MAQRTQNTHNFHKMEGFQDVTAAVTLEPHVKRVNATANTATDSYTITLPYVAEAMGQIIVVHATIADVKAVTVADKGDSHPAFADQLLDTDGDHAVLYCDGKGWYNIGGTIA